MKEMLKREFVLKNPDETDESKRIYADYLEDPTVRKIRNEVRAETPTSQKTTAKEFERWERNSELKWREFARMYPEKAKAYQRHDLDIAHALSAIERDGTD